MHIPLPTSFLVWSMEPIPNAECSFKSGFSNPDAKPTQLF